MGFFKDLIAGPETVKPVEQKAEDANYTEDDKKKLRDQASNIKTVAAEGFDPSKYKTTQAGVEAAGANLVEAAKKNNIDPNSLTINNTQVGAAPTRATTTLDTSQIRQAGAVDKSVVSPIVFDESKIRAMQLYPGDPNAQQQYLMSALQQQAMGQGPSVAQAQFAAANEANLAASLAQQASLRGGYDPAAARQIRQTAADLQAKAAQDAAQARMQEQLNAQTQLATVASQVEGQKQAAGTQSIQGAQTDIQSETARTTTAINSGKLALDAEVTAAAAENEARRQDTEIQKTIADLTDKASYDNFKAELDTKLKQADISSNENIVEFGRQVDVAVRNMELNNDILKTVYGENIDAFKADVALYNDLLIRNAQANISVAATELQLEQEFIKQGMDATNARIRAKNINDTAMVAYKQAEKNRDVAFTRGLVNLGATAAGTAAGAMAGNPMLGAQVGSAAGQGLTGGTPNLSGIKMPASTSNNVTGNGVDASLSPTSTANIA